MTTQPDYLRYLEAAKQAEVADQLRREGYLVEQHKLIGNETFDLLATKHGRTTAYEFKSAGHRRFSKQELNKLQQTAAQAGYTFRMVVAVPPPRVDVEIERLSEYLLAHLVADIPSELDLLSSQTVIDSVHDISVESVKVHHGEITVTGSANVVVTLQFGGSSDSVSNIDAFPFHFEAILDADGALASIQNIHVDVSSFSE